MVGKGCKSVADERVCVGRDSGARSKAAPETAQRLCGWLEGRGRGKDISPCPWLLFKLFYLGFGVRGAFEHANLI